MKKPSDQNNKNKIHSNIDARTIKAIRESLHATPGQYQKNLKGVDSIDWTWKNGLTTTNITYKDRSNDRRTNSQAPPTKACHDIAHFIAAFHDNLEWDYLQEINHLCEYNAVAIEWIMTNCCHSIRQKVKVDPEEASQKILEHLNWFCDDYYHIPSNHPTRASHRKILKNLVENIDTEILARYFDIFYELWCIETELKTSEFEARVTLTANKKGLLKNALAIMSELIKRVESLAEQTQNTRPQPEATMIQLFASEASEATQAS